MNAGVRGLGINKYPRERHPVVGSETGDVEKFRGGEERQEIFLNWARNVGREFIFTSLYRAEY